MNLEQEKRKIIQQLSQVEEEWVIKAIKKLLGLDYESDISDEHKAVLNERIEAYEKDPNQALDWGEVKNDLFNK